ncbi:hypothetical protein MA785_004668 [Vibrio parahaemolyticus]|nr:hypothetical protein [Vibrio parahaemolyticus]EJR2791699.1 hypothetical protein [Vibrio parahaemolyticus]
MQKIYKNEHEESRALFLDEVKRQMVGPFEDEELLEDDAPWDRYHTGILVPAGQKVSLAEYEEEQLPDPSENDGFVDLANAAAQSALGFTCYLEKSIEQISLNMSWATYSEVGKRAWQRKPFNKTIELDKTAIQKTHSIIEVESVIVSLKSKDMGDRYALTFTLVNRKNKSASYGEGYLYQAEMSIFSECGLSSAPLKDNIAKNDPEFWQHELIYRDYVHYATGHGCAVQWEGKSPKLISTTWIPTSEVYKASPEISELNDTKLLSMEFLGNQPKDLVIQELEKLPSLYSKWIESQARSLNNVGNAFSGDRKEKMLSIANLNLENCREQCKRIEEGIKLLKNHKSNKVFKSFQLANLTIRENIKMSVLKKGKTFDFEPSWRPFQIAFILLALPSTIDPQHKDRDVMELIWFPTGGGKTEAYLGLTAVLFFFRYLTASSEEEAAGTAVITRYTLRLLTIQQFERAALMICAANRIKSTVEEIKAYKDFDIGLFVGGSAIPNKMKEVAVVLESDGSSEKTTLPLKRCPACGGTLSTANQKIEQNKLITWCSSELCDYNSKDKPLPIIIVDEQMYDTPPTFVIGTVDKFANMPFTPEMGRLLGRYTKAAPLQLIIQDELHLISDALGTVTALFETAIDHVASMKGAKVKIVGSTATIRRAETQVRKLFDRKSMQFPSPGIHVDDSFFYQSDRKNPGRMYVGIHAQGRSPKHTLSRLAGNCLQATEYTNEKVRDYFYTLVMYFNSMRELGGSLLLLEDDIPKYIGALSIDEGIRRRKIKRFSELTSKLTSDEVPEVLEELDVSWPVDMSNDREPIDAVLATNMISVGVDVSRLGAMIVNGQPKNTSEYIQASSRVGRETGTAGIVFTLYNWTRSRDRSHYEKFFTYHSSFYRHVESSSVTPFASRARDRALHSALIAMVRLCIPEFSENDSAGRIIEQDLRTKVRELIDVICDRVEQTEPEEVDDTKIHLNDILFDWKNKAERACGKLKWTANGKKDQDNFLIKSKELRDDPWEMQRSVRDVEGQVKISMYIRDTE